MDYKHAAMLDDPPECSSEWAAAYWITYSGLVLAYYEIGADYNA
jgi:hypothetical protein